MSQKKITRRDFVKGTLAATTLAVYPGLGCSDEQIQQYDAKDLPTRELGSTGIKIPLIALGTGSRFCAADNDEGQRILTHALDNGLFYWDTANIYTTDTVISEERIGKILKHRRREVFLSSKISSRKLEEAKKDVEVSLARLKTDHFDILKIHSIESLEDVENIEKSGLISFLHQLRQQGITRFIGFSGHSSAEAMAAMVKRFDLDSMLIALNHYSDDGDEFEEHAIPMAAKKGMGVMAMKVIRPRETVPGIDPQNLIKYALSLPYVNGAVIGIDSMELLKENLNLLKKFQPLDKSQMENIRLSLTPFYNHQNVAWMRAEYQDGCWTTPCGKSVSLESV